MITPYFDPDEEERRKRKQIAPVAVSDRMDNGGSANMDSGPIQPSRPAPEVMQRMSSRIAAPVSPTIQAKPVDAAGSYSLPMPYGRPRQVDSNTGSMAASMNVYNPPVDIPRVVPPQTAPGGLPPGESSGAGVNTERTIFQTAGGPPPVSAMTEVKHPKGFWGKLGQTLGRIGEGALLGSQYGLGGAIYGAVKGGVDPYAIAKWKDKNVIMPKYEAERERQIKEYKDQQVMNNVEADNRRADEMMRINQQNQAIAVKDRERNISRQEKEDAEQRGKIEYERAQSTGTAVNPAAVKGTSWAAYGGQIPPRRDAQKPEYRDVGGNLVRINPEGSVESIYSAPPKPISPAEARQQAKDDRLEREHNDKEDKSLANEFEKTKRDLSQAAEEYGAMVNAKAGKTGLHGNLLPPSDDDLKAAQGKVEGLKSQFSALQEQIRSHPRLKLDKSGTGIDYKGSRPGQATSLGPASAYFQ